MSLLLDTSVLFAFLNQDDADHARAKEFLLAVSEGALGTPVVTDLIIAELHNLARACKMAPAFEEAARDLLSGSTLPLLGLVRREVGIARFDRIMEVFLKYRDARVSFTDASLLVMQQDESIDLLATFDRRLGALAARDFTG
ncbi:MAG: PIN domain-containing protein [Euryarchaeota archaeon]|nr:PIN domain-containing protein [Euryarchaeota archaeon]